MLHSIGPNKMLSLKPVVCGPSLKEVAHALSKIGKKEEQGRKEKDEKEKEKVGLRRRYRVKASHDLS